MKEVAIKIVAIKQISLIISYLIKTVKYL